MDYFNLIVGICLLIVSGNWLVKSGSAIASYFNIPKIIVGVTVISLGTSAPELFVSLNATISGSPDIAIGNIVGSNIANIGLVLSITALVLTIPIQKSTIRLDYPVLFVATILFIYFISDLELSRYEGIIMLALLVVYILIVIRQTRKHRFVKADDVCNDKEDKPMKPSWAVILLIVSCGGLVFGSNMLVDGASSIANNLGVSERVISITVIAFGTSIPELATSVIAAFKKQIDISAGNIIGSNIFNIFMIGGISSTVKPLKINSSVMDFDIYFLIGVVVLTGLCFIPLKRPEINKYKGLVLLFAYFAYYIILFYN
jgi:cation:H+ antiporter